MKEYENIKDALKDLLTYNDNDTEFLEVFIDDGKRKVSREFTIKDLQERNFEILVSVCDLLGMSDLYLERGIKNAIRNAKES